MGSVSSSIWDCRRQQRYADFFFQKRSAESFPTFLHTEPIYSEHNKAPINYAVANDRASLLYLANLGCIDQNPWMSRVVSLDSSSTAPTSF